MDLEVAKQLIKKYETGHGAFMVRCDIAERYYRNETDILFKESKKEDENGNPMRNADNRIPRNFHGLIVNQKASYAFTTPPMFDVGNSKANKRITEALGDEYEKNCKDLCVNAANTSIGWLHYWIDEDGVFQYAVVDSKEVIPIWSKDLKKKLLAVLRVYTDLDEATGDMYTFYEYWNDVECQSFKRKTSDVEFDHFMYNDMFVDPEGSELISEYFHDFGDVPFIPFHNNNICTDDLQNIKPLIDVYDKVFSGFINDLDDIQQLIFILSGYGGEDLNGFLQDLKKYKTIKIDGDEAGNGVSTLNIEIPIEARNSVLEATRKAIFEQGQGFDPQPENFGNQSGEALKFMYSLLEMKTGLMETEFRLGFAKLVRAICKVYNLPCDTIVQTWTRTRIKNDTELAQICKDSVGIVSTKTILKNHPFVEDVDAELKELQKEKEEQKKEMEAQYDPFTQSNKDDDQGNVQGGEE